MAPKATRALGGTEMTNRPAPQQPLEHKEGEAAESAARRPPRQEDGNYRPRAGPSAGVGPQRRVVVILAKAGLKIGQYGLVDAYDRSATTLTPTEPHLAEFRPDIVHQCLLALFDSDIATSGLLQVYISTTRDKTIEVSPALRPPRTYSRFKGLMEKLLTEGVVATAEGQWLMRTTRWSIAPQIPYGAEVHGIHNSLTTPVVTALQLAKATVAEPVSDSLQGGIKNVYAFYCVSCTDDSNLDGLDYVTQPVCLSKFPSTPHVACSRICEGYRHATSKQTNTKPDATEAVTEAVAAMQVPALGKKRLRQ
jgi:rRNA small subunit pseudouridine methyltransferase Nep1